METQGKWAPKNFPLNGERKSFGNKKRKEESWETQPEKILKLKNKVKKMAQRKSKGKFKKRNNKPKGTQEGTLVKPPKKGSNKIRG